MFDFTQNERCCGVVDVDGVHNLPTTATSKRIVEYLLGALMEQNDGDGPDVNVFAHYLFTSAHNKAKNPHLTRLEKIAKAIKDFNFGEVVITSGAHNPNTSNIINVLVWTADRDQVEKVYAHWYGEKNEDGTENYNGDCQENDISQFEVGYKVPVKTPAISKKKKVSIFKRAKTVEIGQYLR